MQMQDGLWRREWRTCDGQWHCRLYLVRGARALQLQSCRWMPLADITRQRGRWTPHIPQDGKPQVDAL